MKKLFSPKHLRLLESLSFTPTLYAFDFDGTLARLVATPQDAVMKPSTDLLLRQLGDQAPVAIISGRSIADLKTRLDFSPPYLIGNHGLEGLGTSPQTLKRAQKICWQWGQHLMGHFADLSSKGGDASEAAIELEDKAFSLAIHYRKSSSKKRARAEILKVASHLDPLPRVILGKCVVNLIPPGAPHKGIALAELMDQTGVQSAFYIGDDDTDEDVFSLPQPRILTVRVGRKIASQAQFYIRDQNEIDRLLRTILRFYESGAQQIGQKGQQKLGQIKKTKMKKSVKKSRSKNSP